MSRYLWGWMRPLKKSVWPQRVLAYANVSGREIVWLWRDKKGEGRYEYDAILLASSASDEDVAVFLRRAVGRRSPVWVFCTDVYLQVPTGTLGLILLRLGYDIEHVSFSRTTGIVMFRLQSCKSSRLPREIVFVNISNIIPPHCLYELDRYFKLGLPNDPAVWTESHQFVWWDSCMMLLSWLRHELPGASLRFTAAGVGMSYFRKQFLQSRDIAFVQNTTLFNNFRNATYGGVVIVKKFGDVEGVWHYVDCNNLYLHIAATKKVPGYLRDDMIMPRLSSLVWLSKSWPVTCRALVRRCDYPFLFDEDEQVREEVHERVLTWLNGDELVLAAEMNAIEQVYECYVFHPCVSVPLFAESALSHLSEIKRSHDRLHYHTLKYVYLTALGKFAARGIRVTKRPDIPATNWLGLDRFDASAQTGTTLGYFMGKTFQVEWGVPSQTSNPAIFAHITANGRVHMRYVLSQIDDNDWIYADVDAVIVNEKGLKRLQEMNMLGTEPGKLAVKQWGYNVKIEAARWYEIGMRKVQAGLPRYNVLRRAVQDDSDYTLENFTFDPRPRRNIAVLTARKYDIIAPECPTKPSVLGQS